MVRAASETLVERIYEAAFVPDYWSAVLEDVAVSSGSAAGSLLVFAPPAPPRFRATRITHDSLTAFVASGAWKTNPRENAARTASIPGFYSVTDQAAMDAVEVDPVADSLAALGLGHQVGAVIPLPHGEHAIVTIERWARDGRFEPEMIAVLDGLRPHLARAALTAARLGMERARAAVATLETLGLAAAVLGGSGRVMAVNGLLEADPIFRPGAHGRLVLAHPAADQTLREILASDDAAAGSRSIPLPGLDDRPPGILHVLPLCGAAHDILGGATLVVHAPMRMEANVPEASLLPGLFDLTPREAQIAAALAAGASLKDAADASELRISTARSYLERILRKTGTSQQSQLVALLKGGKLS